MSNTTATAYFRSTSITEELMGMRPAASRYTREYRICTADGADAIDLNGSKGMCAAGAGA